MVKKVFAFYQLFCRLGAGTPTLFPVVGPPVKSRVRVGRKTDREVVFQGEAGKEGMTCGGGFNRLKNGCRELTEVGLSGMLGIATSGIRCGGNNRFPSMKWCFWGGKKNDEITEKGVTGRQSSTENDDGGDESGFRRRSGLSG